METKSPARLWHESHMFTYVQTHQPTSPGDDVTISGAFSAKTKKINAMLCVRFNIGNIRITNTDLVSQFNLIHSSLIWTCCFNMFLVSLRWAAWSTISFISCTGNCNCRGERKALARSLLHKRWLLANMDYCWSQCYSQQHTDLNTNTDWQKLTRVQKSLILHLQRQDESTAEIAAAK